MNRQFQKIALIFALLCFWLGGAAQVTIGSGIEPSKGALLDLKDHSPLGQDKTTATKGLLLPRVNLTDLNKLYPMLPSDYDDASEENERHIGLQVYNLQKCDGIFAQGVYIWTGTQWEQLTNNPVLQSNTPALTFPPALVADGYLVRIPSGQDARAAWSQAYSPSISFSGTNQVTGTWANTSSGSVSGLQFSTNALSPTMPASWTTSPISDISIWPDAMSAATPFQSRESKLTITGIAGAGPCPGGTNQVQVITLNQTNYAIVAGSVASPTTQLVLRIATPPNLPILSNVKWKAEDSYSSGGTGTVPASDILASYTTLAPTATERYDGLSTTNAFSYTGTSTVIQGQKYKTAQIRFSDVEGRAKPVTVDIMQCRGTEDLSGVTITATPAQTSQPSAPAGWGTNVVRHQAKPNPSYVAGSDPAYMANIYEEFYSAYFGAAGRWMTTNLTAYKYDGNRHSTDPGDGTATPGVGASRTLAGPNANIWNPYNTAYWCYPAPSGNNYGTDATEHTNNPHLGLLYTWDAATAGKGGTNGQGNIDGPLQESGYRPEGTNGGVNEEKRRQGICPQGWHLPSDWEWTELERAIIRNKSAYSSAATSTGTDLDSELAGVSQPPSAGNLGTTSFRGLNTANGHGAAMKELCGVNNNIIPNGLSNGVAANGFAALLAGWAYHGVAYYSNGVSMWWSASSGTPSSAWIRQVDGSWQVFRNGLGDGRGSLMSVRCKKD